MPFTFAAPIGSIIAAVIAGKLKVPPIYIVIFASMLQVIGFVLLSTLPASPRLVAAQYGYEVIAGFGCGINISTLVLMTPFSVQKRDNGEISLQPFNIVFLTPHELTALTSGRTGFSRSISHHGWGDRPRGRHHGFQYQSETGARCFLTARGGRSGAEICRGDQIFYA